MDRLVKVGPSAVSTDLVPGRSERPTEPDRDTASGIHREVYTPRGIRDAHHRPAPRGLPASLRSSAGWREEKKKEAEKMASVRSTQESQQDGGRP